VWVHRAESIGDAPTPGAVANDVLADGTLVDTPGCVITPNAEGLLTPPALLLGDKTPALNAYLAAGCVALEVVRLPIDGCSAHATETKSGARNGPRTRAQNIRHPLRGPRLPVSFRPAIAS